MKTLIACLTFTLLFVASQSAEHWNYDEDTNGPSHWSESYTTCKGNRQSPINIDTSATSTYFSLFDRVTFQNYNARPTSTVAQNNGHSVAITITYDEDSTPRVSGGPLGSEEYSLGSLHCHWGQTPDSGSEHTIDGAHLAMECHAVHINTKYASQDEAAENEDGLVVLGFLFEEDVDNKTDATLFSGMVDASVTAETITISGVEDLLKGLNIDVKKPFFSYLGSLTTPGCNEAVSWIVFDHIYKISSDQLNALRNYADLEGHRVPSNYRPTQELNGRKVTWVSDSLISVISHSVTGAVKKLFG